MKLRSQFGVFLHVQRWGAEGGEGGGQNPAFSTSPPSPPTIVEKGGGGGGESAEVAKVGVMGQMALNKNATCYCKRNP